MLLFWRGWGIAVLPIMFAWLFIVIGVSIATKGPEPDPNAGATTYRIFALAFALSAASVFYLAHRRSRPREATDPATGETQLITHRDDFMFIPMKYWAYVFAAAAAFLAIKSFFE